MRPNTRDRRPSAAAQRAIERREREDGAPRLKEEIPRLVSLRLEFEEVQGDGMVVNVKHVRPIVVEHAPSLFEFPCGNPQCDGLHDLTWVVMGALRKTVPGFDGEDPCNGVVGSAPCRRVLQFVGAATYRE